MSVLNSVFEEFSQALQLSPHLWPPEIRCSCFKKRRVDRCTHAVQQGHFRCIQFALFEGCPWGYDTCAAAAASGSLELVQWLRQAGCAWGHYTCTEAAAGGHWQLLAYLQEAGCPWEYKTFSYIVQTGRLELCQWAYEHDCPWNLWAYVAAASKGHLHILQWARLLGLDICMPLLCEVAAANGQVNVLQWAWDTGSRCHDRVSIGAMEGQSLAVLQWAREHECPLQVDTLCEGAAARGDLETLSWAVSTYGGAVDIAAVGSTAAECGHAQVFFWCVRHGAAFPAGSPAHVSLARMQVRRGEFLLCVHAQSRSGALPQLPGDVLKLILSTAELYL